MNSEMIEQDQPSIADPDLLAAMVARELQSRPPEKPAPGKLSGTSTGMLVGGNAADLLSTVYALNRGAREVNPLLGEHPSAGKLLAVKSAGTLAQYLLLRQLAKKHPRGANLAAKIIGGGMGGVAAWNLTQAQR